MSIFQEKFATSIVNLLHSSIFFREFVHITEANGIENISTYSWFLLQFQPTHWTALKMLHHTGRFRIRHMVQAWLFWSSNPDTHYAHAVKKFMREQAVKNWQNIAFSSMDSKCKVPIGEPGYLIAAVTRGKKVIVDEKFWWPIMTSANYL